jgi:hypothetical protein
VRIQPPRFCGGQVEGVGRAEADATDTLKRCLIFQCATEGRNLQTFKTQLENFTLSRFSEIPGTNMTTPSLVTEWAKACHADQLADYPPDNVSTQLIVIIDQVLSSQTSPTASASATANLIQSEHDITHGLSCLIGLFLFAAERNTSLNSLELLVSYLVELAKQPDAINEGPEPKVWDEGGGVMHEISPGAPIIVEGRQLWSGLPMLGWNITEWFQGMSDRRKVYCFLVHNIKSNWKLGPELWTHDLRSPATSEVAAAKWKDLNKLIALIALNPDAQAIPSLAGYINLSRITLSMALEHSPNTRLGKNTAMHLPAAALWFSIAGGELERMCEAGEQKMAAGDVWAERVKDNGSGDSAVVDMTRLQFWKERLAELQQM